MAGGAATKKAKKRAAGKKTAKKATPAPTKAVVDVRSKKDVSKLLDIIKGNKVTLVLIYADWCGHCKTFKQEIWSKLKEMKDRKLPLAEINADVLGETPLANAKIDGYPSVVPIGNDMKMATLKDESGNSTNALPNTRDENMMRKLVSSDAGKVLGNGQGNGKAKGNNENNASKILTAEAEEELRQSTEKLIEGLKADTAAADSNNAVAPPDAVNDMIVGESLPPEAADAMTAAAAEPVAEAPEETVEPAAEANATAVPASEANATAVPMANATAQANATAVPMANATAQANATAVPMANANATREQQGGRHRPRRKTKKASRKGRRAARAHGSLYEYLATRKLH